MRRVLLVAALAAPVVVFAQVNAGDGQVVERNNFSATNGVSYINAIQCADSISDPKVDLEWRIPQFSLTGSYVVIASNTAPSSSSTTPPPNFCPVQDDQPTTGVRAGSVGSSTATSATQGKLVSGSDIVAKTGKLCDGTNEDTEIFVCVHYNTNVAVASGRFHIQTAAPPAPTGLSVGAGEGRLIASWSPSVGGATAADRYFARATPVPPLQPGVSGGDVDSGQTNGTTATINGLTNGQLYNVVVFALSVGRNPSTASVAAQGTPVPSDGFWDFYKGAGGREEGGCGSGGAGPLALLGVAALLAKVRRRK